MSKKGRETRSPKTKKDLSGRDVAKKSVKKGTVKLT